MRWVFVAVCRLSLVVASGGYSFLRCTGFSLRWLLLLRSSGSRCVGFGSCGSRALERRLSSCGARALLLRGMWDLPRPGLEPMSPALAGGFLTTVPPGKPSRVFLISVIVLFITVCLLFSSFRSLLNVSCIFSILFLRFWIIFTITTLNSFSGRLPISSSFIWSCIF